MHALMLSPFVKHNLVAFLSREKQADLLVLKQLIEAGQLAPVIDRSFPLNEAPAAIRYLEAGQVSGKVLITV